MFHWIFPYRFLMEIKILLISAQFCLIYFDFLKTHLSWNVYNLIYDLNFLVFSVWFGLPSWSYVRPEVPELPGTEKVGWKVWPSWREIDNISPFNIISPSVLNVICWETSFNAEDIDIKSQRPQTIKTCSDQIWLWSMWVQSNTKRQSEVAQTIDTYGVRIWLWSLWLQIAKTIKVWIIRNS